MIYSNEAILQLDELRLHYRLKDRLDAARNLDLALDQAEVRIEHDPNRGLPAPRPYPELARNGRAWIKSGRYWIIYTLTDPPVILGVFYEAADIPNRL